ncbi:hypothetical protein CPB84DRAFT_1842180 [Gymnopilus junonius]|uniref:Ribosomal RNA methyltransferase FtsJ domain-containing protein n=1 Tax=Gymnopilus junonius TaxID=109634 RepID=A0A9P5NYE4_GYMJU|nr:hypothetical protein CPB84DRAFT_1842180 [Gymnopilus junonius]
MPPNSIPIKLTPYSGSTTDGSDDETRLSTALIESGAVVLRQLLELKDKGWKNESAERHFHNQRQTADNASPNLNAIWFGRMKGVLREIDQQLDCVPSYGALEFLDLGCCPGGFSSHVLDKNHDATGYGISLPVVDGGHEFTLEHYHRSRFELMYQNLTYYQLSPSNLDDPRLQNLPSEITSPTFDLVLLDGHQLRTQSSALPWDKDRLLISQLIISLEAVKEGGTIVAKLPLPHRPISAKILHLFKILSSEVLAWKPKSMHGNRGTFYAVAKGIGRGPKGSRMSGLILELRALWASLTFGGEEGLGRFINPGDFDFLITTDDLIAHHLGWLTSLGTPLWQVQEEALQCFFRKKNII